MERIPDSAYDRASGAVWQQKIESLEMSEASLPKQPPVWVKDSDAPTCMVAGCGRAFGPLEWRHHCRFCGGVVCSKCSTYMLLPATWAPFEKPDYDWSEPRRVCLGCSTVLEPFQKKWAAQRAHAHQRAVIASVYSPVSFSLESEVSKAASSLANLTAGINYWDGDAEFVHRALHRAVGLLFVTCAKVAFIGGLRVGTGLVVAKLDDSTWSAPCAVGTFGLTFGAVVGAQVNDTITALDELALQGLCSGSKLSLGGAASFAFGPLGRAAQGDVLVDTASTSTTATYSHSRGFYGGVTLEGAYIDVRPDVNHSFYGIPVAAQDLLTGAIKPPHAAAPLYAQLDFYYATATDFIAQLPPPPPRSGAALFFCGPQEDPDEQLRRSRQDEDGGNPFA